jgi:hypothetical protein
MKTVMSWWGHQHYIRCASHVWVWGPLCLTAPPIHTLSYSKHVPSFCSCQKAAGKKQRITKMWGVYCWEYFSKIFMSENCRVVNRQHIDRDRDREVCLYWTISQYELKAFLIYIWQMFCESHHQNQNCIIISLTHLHKIGTFVKCTT